MKKNSKNSPLPNLPSPEEILGLIHKQKRPLRTDSLYRILHVPRQAKRELACMLDALVADGLVVRLPGGLWADAAALKKVTGRFQSAKSGGGTVLPFGAKEGEEIAIPIQHTNDAWPRDIVSVALLPGSHGKQGKVLEIIERGRKEITAKITRREKNVLECRPSDRRLKLTFKVFIENTEPLRDKLKPGLLVSLHPGEKLGPDVWKASLVNIFGAEDKIKVQEALVKSNYQVPTAFPELAKRQADELPPAPLPEEFAGREDLRHLPFVTIDGADARDFDDAVHVEKTPSGWILRVAIADVSHYVAPDKREGSLDAEALRRGNSWYFPSSVEPMLPEALSNGLCSLRPDEDRLAVMVEMPFDFSGNPGKPRFAPIGMRSHARLIYEDVAKFFNGDSGAIPVALRAGMRDAFDLYKVLARKRSERGSLEFELPDPRYTFDTNGRLESMTSAKSDDARLLIEEFMIAANEAVAKFLGEKNLPLLYRCHPAPEETKAEKLLDTLQATALESLPPGLDKDALSNPKTFQTILNKVKGAPSEYVVSRLCLRSMSQARYQPDNVGHFGLASPDYCHFTSPIRRYADLTVHRALKHSLGLPQPIVADFEKLAEIGERLNKTERQALECEREMARRLGCLALKKREGEKFSGVISGVTDFGVFVELNDIPTEGMIRLESLGDDWFELDQRRQALVGQRSGKTWRLGQEVEVLVGDVDLDRLEIRLIPTLPPELEARSPKKKQPRGRRPESGAKASGKAGAKGGASRAPRRQTPRGRGSQEREGDKRPRKPRR